MWVYSLMVSVHTDGKFLCHLRPQPMWTEVPIVHKPPQLTQSSRRDRAAARHRGPRGSLHSSTSHSEARHPAGSSRSLPKTHNSSWGSKQTWPTNWKCSSAAPTVYSTLMGDRPRIQLLLIHIFTWQGAGVVRGVLPPYCWINKLVSQR